MFFLLFCASLQEVICSDSGLVCTTPPRVTTIKKPQGVSLECHSITLCHKIQLFDYHDIKVIWSSSNNDLTFRVLSSPGGLSGSIILRYSSLESLCSDFPSRSAAWSRQAASCTYSCLQMIQKAHKSRAHQKGLENHSLRGSARAVTAWFQQFRK